MKNKNLVINGKNLTIPFGSYVKIAKKLGFHPNYVKLILEGKCNPNAKKASLIVQEAENVHNEFHERLNSVKAVLLK